MGKVVDAIASAAFMFCGYWAFPVTLARVIQRVREEARSDDQAELADPRRRLSPCECC